MTSRNGTSSHFLNIRCECTAFITLSLLFGMVPTNTRLPLFLGLLSLKIPWGRWTAFLNRFIYRVGTVAPFVLLGWLTYFRIALSSMYIGSFLVNPFRRDRPMPRKWDIFPIFSIRPRRLPSRRTDSANAFRSAFRPVPYMDIPSPLTLPSLFHAFYLLTEHLSFDEFVIWVVTEPTAE